MDDALGKHASAIRGHYSATRNQISRLVPMITAIPENNLGYACLLQFPGGASGSGFMMLSKGKQFLVTAKHVLFDKDKMRASQVTITCQAGRISDPGVTKFLIDLTKARFAIHQVADIVVIWIGTKVDDKMVDFTLQGASGASIAQVSSTSGMVSVDRDKAIKRLGEVGIGNDVFLYGYPTSLGIQSSPQFDYEKPLLRKGIIAGIYAHHGTIILDCPVYFGNSGGPVIEVEMLPNLQTLHKVIGVVSQFIPFAQQWINPPTGLVNTEFHNSGYSITVAMDKVLEVMDSSF